MVQFMTRFLCGWAYYVALMTMLLGPPRCEAVRQTNLNMLHMGLATTPAGEYQYLNNPDVGTSSLVVLLAVLHFNQRYGGVLPVFANLKSCNVRIRLVGGGMRDDRGISSVAMRDFINFHTKDTVDIVHGSVRSDVRLFTGD